MSDETYTKQIISKQQLCKVFRISMVTRGCRGECFAGICLAVKGDSEPFLEEWSPKNYLMAGSRVKCDFEHIPLTVCDDRNAI